MNVRLTPAPVSRLVSRVPRRRIRSEPSHTRITWATPLEGLVPGEASADALAGGEDDAGLALEVSDGEERVRIRLRESWLEQGIQLGRYSHKCSHAALSRILSEDLGISRCHLYLRREQDQIVFYDTASTWGLCLVEEPESEADFVRRFAVERPAPGTTTRPLFLTFSVQVRLVGLSDELLN